MSGMMEQKRRRIGIYGGTFDPPHVGHLVAAETVLETWKLDEVVFIPSGTPPHKPGEEVSPARHRYLMTVLATLDNPRFTTSRIELDRPAPSFTVDTLRELTARERDAELFFILGVDAVLGLPTWKEPDAVLRLCQLIVVTRPGYPEDELRERLGELYVQYRERFLLTEIPALDISASRIREMCRSGRSIRYLVPDMVREYIARHKLYGVQGENEHGRS